MYEHKQEIINTRYGCLGGSDAKLLSQIAQLGYVPKSAYKRMAIAKGLIPTHDTPTNRAMEFGNYVEDAIFQSLVQTNNLYKSNPRIESKKFSKPNCKLIAHPDFLFIDSENKCVNVYECKATQYTFMQTRDMYKAQLYVEQTLAREVASEHGKDWKTRLFLVHYSTEGLNLDDEFEFNSNRITVKQIRVEPNYFDIDNAMCIVNDFLETFTEYYGDGEEVDGALLPENVRSQFAQITQSLAEIKEREQQVDEFKKRLYEFMKTKDIKSIKSDAFSIVRVDESESRSFDSKRYVEDEMQAHPRKMAKIVKQYTKVTKRSGFVQIKLKTKN